MTQTGRGPGNGPGEGCASRAGRTRQPAAEWWVVGGGWGAPRVLAPLIRRAGINGCLGMERRSEWVSYLSGCRSPHKSEVGVGVEWHPVPAGWWPDGGRMVSHHGLPALSLAPALEMHRPLKGPPRRSDNAAREGRGAGTPLKEQSPFLLRATREGSWQGNMPSP